VTGPSLFCRPSRLSQSIRTTNLNKPPSAAENWPLRDFLCLHAPIGRLDTSRKFDSRQRIAEVSEKALEILVEAAASGKKLEFKKLDEMAAGEAQIRTLGQAIERLTERMIPLAQMGTLREEAHALEARARALEGIAQERAERVLQQLRGAVSQEMVLPVDMSKGVAGALLARAAGLKRCAVQISENADRMERAYQDRRGA